MTLSLGSSSLLFPSQLVVSTLVLAVGGVVGGLGSRGLAEVSFFDFNVLARPLIDFALSRSPFTGSIASGLLAATYYLGL